MSQQALLKIRGLYTFPNILSEVPDGALAEALNVVISRNSVIEPRRGYAQYGQRFGSGDDRSKQIIDYKDRILVHYGSTLAFDSSNAGDFINFNGIFNEVENDLRIKSIEANGNLYFTTNEGVKKISALTASDFSSSVDYITDAGGVKALDISANIDYTSPGFFLPNSKIAYRLVWGITDRNNNLILGSPSSRTVVVNSSTTDSAVVDIQFSIPNEITSDYFYQIYRTAIFQAGTVPLDEIDPGDEMNLIVEDFPSSAQLIAGSVSLTDITPDDFRQSGTPLYTNPSSGDGIEQSNEKPPFSKDITLYKGYTFYGNTATREQFNLSQLSVQALISGTSTITISDGITSRTYTYRGTIESYTANFTTITFPGGKATMDGKYFTIAAANDIRKYIVWYDNTGTTVAPTLSGYLPIRVNISASADTAVGVANATFSAIDNSTTDFNQTSLAGILTIHNADNGYINTVVTDNIPAFTIIQDNLGTGEDIATQKVFLPRVPAFGENGPSTSQQIDEAARSLVRIINGDTSSLVYAYYLSGFDDVPGQMLFQRRTLTGDAFYFTANSTATGNEFSPAISTSGTSVISTNEVTPNRLYYSKFQQPEAVPLVNFIDVGPKDKVIKRIIALRDSLFVFKEDGVYRLTGDVAPFQIAPFDSSVTLRAPDSACVLNNQIYAFTSQGVVTVTDTGVSVISRPIEDKLLSIIRDGFNYQTASFGVPYESDRAYLLWTVTNMNDTVSTQCFRYDSFTNTWTRWDHSASCGRVKFINDKMYIGATDNNFIEQERKNRDRTDHADRQFDLEINANGINKNQITVSNITNIDIGDVLLQTQYLTMTKYNQLLGQLDLDPYLANHDYLSSLQYQLGENIFTKLTGLTTKLDAQAGLSFNDYVKCVTTYSAVGSTATFGITTSINSPSHNLKTGRLITISSSTTTPNINGKYAVTVINANNFTIPITTTVGGTLNWNAQLANFDEAQGAYNAIVNQLNSDDGLLFSNYPLSTGTIDFETTIMAIDQINDILTGSNIISFMPGLATIFTAFNTRIDWQPSHFGDPSILKQVSQGTVLFENNNFSNALVAYSSDLSPSFEIINFSGSGLGDWGEFIWGDQNWGGFSSAKPLRTLIPLQKQRCRYIKVRFEHKAAFENYSLFGISLTFRGLSERAYR